jgi:hypothetical protein
MKQITLFTAMVLLAAQGFARQDTTNINILKRNVVTVTETSEKVRVKVGEEEGIEVITNQKGDTTSIRLGNRTFDVIENHTGTKIHMSRDTKERKKGSSRFPGTWESVGMGINTFHKTDYSAYNGQNFGEFFDINHSKSITVNINFAEYAFTNKQNNFGLVTGLGLSFMDFRFDQPITVTKETGSGLLIPVELPSDGLRKSKLNVSYLTAPLILETVTPLKYKAKRLTLGAGVIGSLNIGSHTKIKSSDGKSKERRNFNINPFKYDLTGRIGFGDLCIFVNYGMTPLFKEGKGPELVPVTAGISLLL